MKRSPLRKIGKVGSANLEANRILKKIFAEKGIFSCEMKIPGICLGSFTTAFAHRHKRNWYKGNVKKLSDFNQVVLACVVCHTLTENNRELNEEVFTKLRGKEKI